MSDPADMPANLPAIIPPGALITPTDTYRVPALTDGDQAGWRFVEFFTVNINNPNTLRAYARACSRLFGWCDDRGLTLATIQPVDVAAWMKQLQEKHGAPGVKQQLAAVRMLFDWLITGQVAPVNPAAATRGPQHVVKTGKTPVLDAAKLRILARKSKDGPQARRLLALAAVYDGASRTEAAEIGWSSSISTALSA